MENQCFSARKCPCDHFLHVSRTYPTLGGAVASREANRMVAEKVTAFGEAAAKVATGGTTRSVVKGYRKKVRANRRRLTK